ncbi:hypothetical protein [Gilliamella apicola]|uniref:hypothetical protein n=1 Tax=Gilliamella apicola TaxID=1196095 RepID=UPI0009FD1894|nr:hypothetical protein [Gilliamella apicola]ORF47391.1 hypothetical protein B5803_12225 [Gilliamella apicola]ORF48245.1 hypothetical protein B5799_09380 [Gilliamella apicola]ORF50987.1 hypothetical protein B5802_11990 [Gilliamella apicola]
MSEYFQIIKGKISDLKVIDTSLAVFGSGALNGLPAIGTQGLMYIRVRFNRVTRQVYIQRPKYCDGTVVFKWDHIMLGNQSR